MPQWQDPNLYVPRERWDIVCRRRLIGTENWQEVTLENMGASHEGALEFFQIVTVPNNRAAGYETEFISCFKAS